MATQDQRVTEDTSTHAIRGLRDKAVAIGVSADDFLEFLNDLNVLDRGHAIGAGIVYSESCLGGKHIRVEVWTESDDDVRASGKTLRDALQSLFHNRVAEILRKRGALP